MGGNIPIRNSLRQPLPRSPSCQTPGSPISTGLFLRPAAQKSEITRFHFAFASHQRNPAILQSPACVKIAAETPPAAKSSFGRESRGSFSPVRPATNSSRSADSRSPRSMRISAPKALLFAQDSEQQVLCADVLVAQALPLLPRPCFRMRLHSALSGTSTEVEMRSRMVIRASISLRMDSIEPCLPQESICQRFVLAHQAEQTKLLRLDVRDFHTGWLRTEQKKMTRPRFFLYIFRNTISSLSPPGGPPSPRLSPSEVRRNAMFPVPPTRFASRCQRQIVRRDQRTSGDACDANRFKQTRNTAQAFCSSRFSGRFHPPAARAALWTSARAIATRCCFPARKFLLHGGPGPVLAAQTSASPFARDFERKLAVGLSTHQQTAIATFSAAVKSGKQLMPLPEKTPRLDCEIPARRPRPSFVFNRFYAQSILYRSLECLARRADASKRTFSPHLMAQTICDHLSFMQFQVCIPSILPVFFLARTENFLRSPRDSSTTTPCKSPPAVLGETHQRHTPFPARRSALFFCGTTTGIYIRCIKIGQGNTVSNCPLVCTGLAQTVFPIFLPQAYPCR